MPELPEVETIRLQLDRVLTGLKITGVEVLKKKSFSGEIGEIRDRRVIGVKRKAKITIIELEGGVYLAIHLKMTGQLIFRKQEAGNSEQSKRYCEQKEGPYAVCELPNKYTRVIISFNNGGKPCLPAGRLYFNDLRIFGWVRVVRDIGDLGVEKLGPEANDEREFTLEYFKNIIAKSKKPIKLLLLDQEKISGLGNIYANEALFKAGILPARKSSTLTDEENKKLRESIISVLNEAIEHKGSSDKDESYRQITGEKGDHQNYLMVYGRKGESCPKCGGVIQKVKIGGRGTFICRRCQK